MIKAPVLENLTCRYQTAGPVVLRGSAGKIKVGDVQEILGPQEKPLSRWSIILLESYYDPTR